MGLGWNGFSYQSPLLPRNGGSGRGEAHRKRAAPAWRPGAGTYEKTRRPGARWASLPPVTGLIEQPLAATRSRYGEESSGGGGWQTPRPVGFNRHGRFGRSVKSVWRTASTSGGSAARRSANSSTTTGSWSKPFRSDGCPASAPSAAGLPLAGAPRELVQPLVQRLRRRVVSAGATGLRTTPSRLPKLDVEGSSPFARFSSCAGNTHDTRHFFDFLVVSDSSHRSSLWSATPVPPPRRAAGGRCSVALRWATLRRWVPSRYPNVAESRTASSCQLPSCVPRSFRCTSRA